MSTNPIEELIEAHLDDVASTVDVTDTDRATLRTFVACVTAALDDDTAAVVEMLRPLERRELTAVAVVLADITALLIAERSAATDTDALDHLRALGRWATR